jgi:hypothetical protein
MRKRFLESGVQDDGTFKLAHLLSKLACGQVYRLLVLIMQFSTQQVAGGAQYGPRTRVGNWFEDIVLQEERWAADSEHESTS